DRVRVPFRVIDDRTQVIRLRNFVVLSETLRHDVTANSGPNSFARTLVSNADHSASSNTKPLSLSSPRSVPDRNRIPNTSGHSGTIGERCPCLLSRISIFRVTPSRRTTLISTQPS